MFLGKRRARFCDRYVTQITKTVVICYIEIAGVNGTISLYDLLHTADAALFAGFGCKTKHQIQIIFKLTDKGSVSPQAVSVPEIEKFA